jgi:hypothetical protein
MKSALVLCFVFSFALFPLEAQQIKVLNGSGQQIPIPPQTIAPPPPLQQDAQAVSILNQALTAGGGTQAISAVTDFTEAGTVTYPAENGVQGAVKVTGLRGTEFRIDAEVPGGTRSWTVHEGVVTSKTEKGHIFSTAVKATVPSSDAFPFETPLFPSSIAFPHRQLATVSNNVDCGLTYKGIVQVDGRSVHDIELQLAAPHVGTSPQTTARARIREVFIDTSTFQIVATKETLPRNVVHELHYSDYRSINGILMPFSLSEHVGGQMMWTIQLSQINFNTGLDASSFALQ